MTMNSKNAEFSLNPITEALGSGVGSLVRRKVHNELNVAFISDVHVGHNKVPACDIVDGLYAAFPDNEETAALDAIFIAGDFFDRQLHLSADHMDDIQAFIVYLLRICEANNIILRVLEGTPSHDRKQCVLFTQLQKILDCKVDLRWVTELSIEHIDSLDIDVLYVPDEWGDGPDSTWKEVKELLYANGLSQVDFCIMHGMFEFQLPPAAQHSSHNSDRYLGITRHYISIGHHHVQRQHKRILIQGSFDRTKHGEEGDKGHYRVTVRLEGSDTIRFVPNKYATVFKGINLLGKDIIEARDVVDAVAKEHHRGHLKLVVDKGSVLAESLQEFALLYPTFRFTMDKENGEEKDTGMEFIETFTGMNIDRESINRIMTDRLKNHNSVVAKRALELLEEVA